MIVSSVSSRWHRGSLPREVWRRNGFYRGHHRPTPEILGSQRRLQGPEGAETEGSGKHGGGRRQGRGERTQRQEAGGEGARGRPRWQGGPRREGTGQDIGAEPRLLAEGGPPQRDGPGAGLPDQGGADLPVLQRPLRRGRDQLRQDPEQPHAQQEAGQGHALPHLLSAHRVRRRLVFPGRQRCVSHTEEALGEEVCLCLRRPHWQSQTLGVSEPRISFTKRGMEEEGTRLFTLGRPDAPSSVWLFRHKQTWISCSPEGHRRISAVTLKTGEGRKSNDLVWLVFPEEFILSERFPSRPPETADGRRDSRSQIFADQLQSDLPPLQSLAIDIYIHSQVIREKPRRGSAKTFWCKRFQIKSSHIYI